VATDSNQSVRSFAPNHCDEYFIELCALSTTDALTIEECRQLELHLSHCASCRELKAQYEGVIATTLPAIAAGRDETEDDPTPDSWSQERAEASLMARIERENISPDKESKTPRTTSRWRHLPWPYAGAAVLLAASLCTAAYRAGVLHQRRLSAVVLPPPSQSDVARTPHDGFPPAQAPVNEREEQQTARVTALHNELQASLSSVARLEEQKISLENQLAGRNADLERGAKQRADLEQQLSLAQSNSQNLQDKVNLIAAKATPDNVPLQTAQAQIEELTASLHKKDEDLARDEELLQHDRDIRNLIGSRDLYFTEIYDVAKNGETQKPIGRLFYTKGKSLVFYAYDLDQQPGVKLASTFQAWGSKGIDQQHAINLGIFYQDDQNKKRWVLKSNDPTTLNQIDAVFVTVEPNGKSTKPTGKPLLFTYLRMAPNHP
jgi:hypothetical protein